MSAPRQSTSRRRRFTAKDLRTQLEGGARHPFYLLHGEEEYEREQACHWLVEYLRPAVAPEFNVDTFHADSLDISRFVDLYHAYPMMAEYRVLVIRGCEKLNAGHASALESLVADPVDGSIVIAVGGKVDMRRKLYRQMGARGCALEFRVPFDNQVPQWITRFASQRGIRLAPEAVHLLQLYAGTNLRELAGELEKLVTFVGEGTPITATHVEELVGASRGVSIFELTDAVGRLDHAKASELLHELLAQGEEPTRIVPMISRHMQLLLKTQQLERAGMPREEMARQLGISPFFLQGYRDQGRRVSSDILWRSMGILLDSDARLKSRGRRQQAPTMDLCLARISGSAAPVGG